MVDDTSTGDNQPKNQAWPQELAEIKPLLEVGGVRVYAADSLVPWANRPKDWRIYGIMPKGGYGVISAAKKTLKTETTTVQMSLSVANSIDFVGDPRYPVKAPCPVIVVINEGADTYIKSLKRSSEAMGLSDIGPVYVIPANGLKFDSEDLNEIIDLVIEKTGAEVVFYDATFGFISGDVKAASLFSMADNLAPIKALHDRRGVDCWIVHHFNKGQTGDPDLSHNAWAGFDAWADQWILLTHRKKPRPDVGQFWLGMVVGFRGGLEWAFELDVGMGRFDMDTAQFVGAPSWSIEPVGWDERTQWGRKDGKHTSEEDRNRAAVGLLIESPWSLNKSRLKKAIGGNSGEASEWINKRVAEGDFVEVSDVPKIDSSGRHRKGTVLQISPLHRGSELFGLIVPQAYPDPEVPPTHEELAAGDA